MMSLVKEVSSWFKSLKICTLSS